MMTARKIAISTCPNDTFAFAGLLSGEVSADPFTLDFELVDIQQLNELVLEARVDVSKVSFAAATRLPNWSVLPVGSALGFGNGPLLLAPDQTEGPPTAESVIWCPGEQTTASMLVRMFHPQATRHRQALFSDIMPAIVRGEADFGVCIHEGRFTYREHGLRCVEDLGQRWEAETRLPLPLGGLIARDGLPTDEVMQIARLVRRSLRWALESPEKALPMMRQHAQEFSDDVLMRHVELYVNEHTVDLGTVGRNALIEFWKRSGASMPPSFVDVD